MTDLEGIHFEAAYQWVIPQGAHFSSRLRYHWSTNSVPLWWLSRRGARPRLSSSLWKGLRRRSLLSPSLARQKRKSHTQFPLLLSCTQCAAVSRIFVPSTSCAVPSTNVSSRPNREIGVLSDFGFQRAWARWGRPPSRAAASAPGSEDRHRKAEQVIADSALCMCVFASKGEQGETDENPMIYHKPPNCSRPFRYYILRLFFPRVTAVNIPQSQIFSRQPSAGGSDLRRHLLATWEQAMANMRLIKIVGLGNGAAFQPDPSSVQAGDRVHWNNETNEDHWLERVPTGFLTNNIPAGEVSNPGFVANEGISYRCRFHPQEQGTIAIVPAVVVAAVAVPAVVAPAVVAPAEPDAMGGKGRRRFSHPRALSRIYQASGSCTCASGQ